MTPVPQSDPPAAPKSVPPGLPRSDPPAAGAHGGDGVAIAAWLGVPVDEVLDLSASLNPFGPDIEPLVAHHASAVRRYSDPSALEGRLAALLDAEPARVVLTNGASEAIALVARVLGTGRVDEPEFSLYRRHLQLDADAGLWRSNPHSPSGRLAAPNATAAVWDEAYWQLATGTWTRGDDLRGSVVIGSLTKLFATPGLRVGYVLAPNVDTAAEVRRHRPEWSVSALAIAVVDELLSCVDLPALAERVAGARDELVSALVSRGLHVEAADAPWVLVHDTGGLRDRLARHGVVVRDCASFGLPATVRIGVPDADGLRRLTVALDRELALDREHDPKDR